MKPRSQQGFAIVSAIFILVVVAALGAFIVNISTTQQIGSALDVQGARVYQAARAGVEWGIFQVQSTAAYNFGYNATTGAATSPNSRACPASPTTFAFPSAPTLSSFSVTVTCNATTDGSGGPTIYRIIAIACNQTSGCPNETSPGANYIERRVEASF